VEVKSKSPQNAPKSEPQQSYPSTRSRSQTCPPRRHSNVEIGRSGRNEVQPASVKNENSSNSSTAMVAVQKRSGIIYTNPEPLPLTMRKKEPRQKRKVSEELGFDGQPPRARHRHSWQSTREKEYMAYQLGINVEELDDSS